MPVQNPVEIKEKIISSIRRRGPSLPVYVAKDVELSILFTSAFLSELLGDKRLKMSHMRVGSSPLYYLDGQEPQLENFSDYLKSKEKEAYSILRERKFLKDSELEPAIRVALRGIRDFAIPFRKDEELFWRYFTSDEKDFNLSLKPMEKPKEEKKEDLDIFGKVSEKPVEEKEEKLEEKKIVEKVEKPKTVKKKTAKSLGQGKKFLEKVTEFLNKSSVEIVNIEGIKKEELVLRVRKNGEEQLLVAYNKKKITEKDIVKAAKKAAELNLKYSIFSLGELPKKISELLEALGNLRSIGRVE